MNNTPLVVIGVLERKGANTFGVDKDDIVLAPWRTIKFKISYSQPKRSTGVRRRNFGDRRELDHAIPESAAQSVPGANGDGSQRLSGPAAADLH